MPTSTKKPEPSEVIEGPKETVVVTEEELETPSITEEEDPTPLSDREQTLLEDNVYLRQQLAELSGKVDALFEGPVQVARTPVEQSREGEVQWNIKANVLASTKTSQDPAFQEIVSRNEMVYFIYRKNGVQMAGLRVPAAMAFNWMCAIEAGKEISL